MAHECPYCWELCYCDIDDTMLDAPDDCTHRCERDDSEEPYMEDIVYSDVWKP